MRKALLLSYTTNWRGVWNYDTLRMWQTSKALQAYLGKQVDLLKWSDLKDFNNIVANYDTIFLCSDDGNGSLSSYKDDLFQTLKKFAGKKHVINWRPLPERYLLEDHRKILKDYSVNDLSVDFSNFERNSSNIIFGTNVALNLWEPDTYTCIGNDFNFSCCKLHDKATFFFEEIEYDTKASMYRQLDKLIKAIKLCHAKEKHFYLPIKYGLYESEFLERLCSELTKAKVEIYQAKNFRGENLFKYALWDWKTNTRLNDKYYEKFI